MPSIILFNEDTKSNRRRLRVDEDPEQVAAGLSSGFAQVTTRGKSVWVNASSVRLVRGVRSDDEPSAEADD